VSTANIAQLAVDLLIASLSLRVIGVFDSRDLVPIVGGREDDAEGISTPLECELRAHPSSKRDDQEIPHSVWERRVRRCGHSTTVTRIGGTSQSCRVQAAFLTRISPESSRGSKSLSTHSSNFSKNQGSLQPFFCPASTCLTGRMYR
jgi:hypothetical protein